jgi:glutaredoxin-like protein NrdH
VDGEDRGKVLLYALSTCVWCRKTKALLGDLGVAYDFVDVDLLEPGEKDLILDEVRKHNPQGSFPTIVIDGGKRCIKGFKEEEIREAVGRP